MKQPVLTLEGGGKGEPIEKRLQHLQRAAFTPLLGPPSGEVTHRPTTQEPEGPGEGTRRPFFRIKPCFILTLVKTGVGKVFSVLTHLRDAGDAPGCGDSDPWEMEGKRSE